MNARDHRVLQELTTRYVAKNLLGNVAITRVRRFQPSSTTRCGVTTAYTIPYALAGFAP